jgi:membrane protein involved in colicin uptake
MGASVGAENIALHIQTTADNAAIVSTRSTVTAMAEATVAATEEMVAATDRATQSESTYASSLAASSTATQESIALRERFNALMLEHGNDMQRVAAILLEEQAAEAEAAQATAQHTAALEQETVAATEAAVAIEQEATAERVATAADREFSATTEAVIAATEQKAAAVANADTQFRKIPASARTAANAMSVLTQAAIAGKGGISGIANAAGGLAFGVAALVPELALLAAGIGAVVTVGTLLVEVFRHTREERDKLAKSLVQPLNNDPALQLYLEGQKRAAEEAKRIAEEQQRRREQDARKAGSLEASMAEETQAAIDRRTLSEEGAASARAVREERRREEEIRALQIDEDDKTRLILAAQADRDAQLQEIAKQASDRRAEEEKREQEKQQREADRAAEEFRRIVLSGIEAAIRSSDSYIQAVTRALLTPLANYLESVAEAQIVDAAVSASHLDFIGAARHAAVAALAIAGARKVASIGGLNSSGGGGGGAPSAGYSGGSTFTPSAQAQGATNVTIQFVKPTTGEVINEISWNLQRNATLNKPIYIPATAGGLS